MAGTNNSCNYRPTQYNVQTGGASGTLNNVAPSSTSGVPVISQGASSQPIFGTAVVAGGGTGDTSFTAYAPVCGGTTTTAALQSASTGISTSGYVLTSNGASSLPTFQAGTGFTSLNVQKFTTSGTYTPTTNMLYCVAEVVGGGAGGASVSSTYGGGGGGGAYVKGTYSSSTIGASQSVTIGAGGSAGSSGGNTSFGALITSNGGSGGSAAGLNGGAGGAGGTGTGGSYAVSGTAGGIGYVGGNGSLYGISGYGGQAGGLSGSAQLVFSNGNTNGNTGVSYGGGGSGAVGAGAGSATGGSGAGGIIIVTEYVWSVPASLPVWSDQSSNFNAVGGNGYFVTGTTTATLPGSPLEGATIMFAVDSTSVLTITANTGQYIRLGTAISASAGTCANNARGDSIELVFRSSDSVWLAVPGTQGIWSIT